MRIQLTIPHFFSRQRRGGAHGSSLDDADSRVQSLRSCLWSVHQLFGQPQCVIQLNECRTSPANQQLSAVVHLVVCTTESQHLLDQLRMDPAMYQQYSVDCEPKLLGLECYNVLCDRWSNYDWYGYMEDDLFTRIRGSLPGRSGFRIW